MVDSRGRLEELRQQTLRRLARLTGDFDGVVAASRDSNADDEHDPEGATIAFERSQIASLVRLAQDHLEEIDAAVARLDAGLYGVCQGCGQPIAPERLDARPVASTCIACESSR
jgi:RNA polymerase-binding transcription factor DksA